MQLQMTITLGNVIQLVLTIAALFLAYTAIRERLARLETMVTPIWHHWNRRGTIERRHEDPE